MWTLLAIMEDTMEVIDITEATDIVEAMDIIGVTDIMAASDAIAIMITTISILLDPTPLSSMHRIPTRVKLLVLA